MHVDYEHKRKGIDYELLIGYLMISAGVVLLLMAFGVLK